MLSSRYVRLLLGLSMGGLIVAIGCGSDEREGFQPTPGASSSGESSGFNPQDAGLTDSMFDPDAACATTKIEAKRAPANILFIVDRSGSMNCNPPPTTTSAVCEQNPTTANATVPTKWFTTKEALKKAIAKMPPEDSAGLTLFNVDNTCGVVSTPNVPVKKVDDQQLIDLATLLDGVAPEGLTPIVGAVTLGYNHLHTTSTFVGRKYIVLITDGQETCAEGMVDNFLATTVPNALAVGIRTFVIGAPGSEPARSLLSRVAWEGGTASSPTCTHKPLPADIGDCHFDLTDPSLDLSTALGQALDKVSRDALTCEYDVPTSETGTVDLGKVNVVYSPANGAQQTIPQDPSKECQLADGWQYSPDGKRIIMCGAACDKLRNDTTGSVSIQLGCLTVVR
jgi:hypothetical protein